MQLAGEWRRQRRRTRAWLSVRRWGAGGLARQAGPLLGGNSYSAQSVASSSSLGKLPEVYVAKSRGSDLDAVKLMDEIANAMAEHGIDAALRDRNLSLSRKQDYAENDFKFNPYGIVRVEA